MSGGQKTTGRVSDYSGSSLDIDLLARLAETNPAEYALLVQEVRKDFAHRRWLAWSDLIAQTLGHLSGLAALLSLVAVAWHAIDHGDATEGAAIITAGAAAIVAVFVTGRLTRPK